MSFVENTNQKSLTLLQNEMKGDRLPYMMEYLKHLIRFKQNITRFFSNNISMSFFLIIDNMVKLACAYRYTIEICYTRIIDDLMKELIIVRFPIT